MDGYIDTDRAFEEFKILKRGFHNGYILETSIKNRDILDKYNIELVKLSHLIDEWNLIYVEVSNAIINSNLHQDNYRLLPDNNLNSYVDYIKTIFDSVKIITSKTIEELIDDNILEKELNKLLELNKNGYISSFRLLYSSTYRFLNDVRTQEQFEAKLKSLEKESQHILKSSHFDKNSLELNKKGNVNLIFAGVCLLICGLIIGAITYWPANQISWECFIQILPLKLLIISLSIYIMSFFINRSKMSYDASFSYKNKAIQISELITYNKDKKDISKEVNDIIIKEDVVKNNDTKLTQPILEMVEKISGIIKNLK